MSKSKLFVIALVFVFILAACAAPAAEEAAPAAEEDAAPAADAAASDVDVSDLTFAICVKSIGANWFSRLEQGILEWAGVQHH